MGLFLRGSHHWAYSLARIRPYAVVCLLALNYSQARQSF